MRAIKLKHGTVFMEIDGVSIRVSTDGRVEISPILYDSLEWEMSTTPPSEWEYLTEGDARALDGDAFEKARALANSINKSLGR